MGLLLFAALALFLRQPVLVESIILQEVLMELINVSIAIVSLEKMTRLLAIA